MKILIISDIHGNAEALRAVLVKESDADRTLFLGDTISPGPQPNETIELLAPLPGVFIAGNHDFEVLEPERLEDWPAEWRAYAEWVNATLDPAGYAFIQALEAGREHQEDGIRLYLGHGELDGRPGIALPDATDETLARLANGSESPHVLFGHSHVQFSRTVNGQAFFNPGSVGQNHCGRQLACYGVIEDGIFDHRQAAYDPGPWLAAVDQIEPLDEYPEFRERLKEGQISGFGLGKRQPWTRLAEAGYF